ncbi:hypothetical protein A2524_03385 [Candidatus Wolfebacteria bacterium RIFOXYD12_FULL_48_21]|nr:MAG: hypothetical protein A2524_03385 [Candidatus Wolfebacteria bacterium RIFOXYD12_FULL_48_21]OGM97246.1 MAG: hypothetical protein A2532_03185 [Candidatus Wolfebacteria bacterium RIFOXYD2_FULL_48_11]
MVLLKISAIVRSPYYGIFNGGEGRMDGLKRKKVYINTEDGPIKNTLGVLIACALGRVVEDMASADEVLCTNVNEALDLLLAGKRVILFAIGVGEGNNIEKSAEALGKNERFKELLSVFTISFIGKDGEEMKRFTNHIAGKGLA